MARHIIGRQPYKWAIRQSRGTPQLNNLDRSKKHFRLKYGICFFFLHVITYPMYFCSFEKAKYEMKTTIF